MREMTKDILSRYDEVSAQKILSAGDYFLQATFVRKDFHILSSGVLLEKPAGCGLAIYVQVPFGKDDLYICNLHGTSRPSKKIDTADRLRQSQGLMEYFREKTGVVIIGGDFNLFPDTESIQMFEKNGYRNLIKDFEVKTTRNHYAWDRFPRPHYYYSDYVFMNPDSSSIRSFSVLENEVSDHLPLILDIDPKEG